MNYPLGKDSTQPDSLTGGGDHEWMELRVVLMLRFSVATERHESLVAFLARAKPYYEAPGGIDVRLFRNPNAPEQFIEVVTYRDEATYRRDQLRVEADPRMQGLLAEWRSFHLDGVGVETYEEVVISR